MRSRIWLGSQTKALLYRQTGLVLRLESAGAQLSDELDAEEVINDEAGMTYSEYPCPAATSAFAARAMLLAPIDRELHHAMTAPTRSAYRLRPAGKSCNTACIYPAGSSPNRSRLRPCQNSRHCFNEIRAPFGEVNCRITRLIYLLSARARGFHCW